MIKMNKFIIIYNKNNQSNNRVDLVRLLSRFLLSFCSVYNYKGQRTTKEFKQETETAARLARIAPLTPHKSRARSMGAPRKNSKNMFYKSHFCLLVIMST